MPRPAEDHTSSSSSSAGGDGDSRSINDATTSTPTIELIPLPNHHEPKINEGKFKWLRGIITDGHLYGIPAWSNHGVLKVRLREDDEECGDDTSEENRRIMGGSSSRVTLLPLPKKNPAVELEPETERFQMSVAAATNNDGEPIFWFISDEL